MQYLHDNGIIHGDLKPEKILIDSDFYPCICDFGLSRCFPDSLTNSIKLTISGQFGTPLYMSPELLNESKTIRPGIDVYAFSLILYEIITGQKLFFELGEIDDFTLTSKIIEGYRPILDERINDKMKDLISRCWSKNVEDRPSFHQIFEKLSTDFSYFDEVFDKDEVNYYIEMSNDKKKESSKESVKNHSSKLRNQLRRIDKEKKDLEKKEEKQSISLITQNKFNGLYLIPFHENIDPEKIKNYQMKEDKESFYKLGIIYYYGKGVEKNYSKAIEYFRKAAELGDPCSMTNLGVIYFKRN